MKKQIVTILMTSALALEITACGAGTAEDQASGEEQTDTGAATGSSNILIAYFSVPEDVDTEGIDADAGASIVVDDGQVKGNLEYTAGVIQQTTGGDLLRIETSNPALYAKLHPQDGHHQWQVRKNCLDVLRAIGYQVGTGDMSGLPGQTIEDLADDILFYRDMDIDMIGMGPYVVHHNTPLGKAVVAQGLDSAEGKRRRLELGLKMIAVTRLFLPDVNIASTTALQALHPMGRELGLKAGANVLMPIVTVPKFRSQYLLYDNKPCVEDTPGQCKNCLAARVASVGDTVGLGQWGDSPHFFHKQKT